MAAHWSIYPTSQTALWSTVRLARPLNNLYCYASFPTNRPRFEEHLPTRPVDRDKAERALSENIKKATNAEEIAPKQKHVRSESARPSETGPEMQGLTRCHPLPRRLYHLHMGLPFIPVHLDWAQGAAHS